MLHTHVMMPVYSPPHSDIQWIRATFHLIYLSIFTDWRPCGPRHFCRLVTGDKGEQGSHILCSLVWLVSLQCCTPEHKWAIWFIDVNKDRIVLHCLERARLNVPVRSTHYLNREFISKRYTLLKCNVCLKFKGVLGTQLWPCCCLFVCCPWNRKMDRYPCPMTTNQHIMDKKGN